MSARRRCLGRSFKPVHADLFILWIGARFISWHIHHFNYRAAPSFGSERKVFRLKLASLHFFSSSAKDFKYHSAHIRNELDTLLVFPHLSVARFWGNLPNDKHWKRKLSLDSNEEKLSIGRRCRAKTSWRRKGISICIKASEEVAMLNVVVVMQSVCRRWMAIAISPPLFCVFH